MVVLSCLVWIVCLFLESGPPLLANKRIAVLLVLLRIVLEEGGRGRRLRLVVVARVSADVLTLIEFVVVLHILLHGLANWMILIVVHYVSVCNILCMDTPTSFDHRKLLSVEILVRV